LAHPFWRKKSPGHAIPEKFSNHSASRRSS
jgi:hypothetical protein